MKVKDVMTTDLKTCTPDTTIAEAAHLMWEGDCGILPVVDDGELVGAGPGGGFVPTGEPTTLTLTPIHLTAGGVARPGSPWQVYYGGGPSLLLWEDDNAEVKLKFYSSRSPASRFASLAMAAATRSLIRSASSRSRSRVAC